MPGRKKFRARKRRARRQKMLNLMERIKKKEREAEQKSPVFSCSEGELGNKLFKESSDSATGTESNFSMQVSYEENMMSSSTDSKENQEPANFNGLEKRKSEFSSVKRANKRTRTSSLNKARKKDLMWPEKNSSTSCLTSWLVAAEDIFISSPASNEVNKTKRNRDETSTCKEDMPQVCQPVKKTKNIPLDDEPLVSPLRSTVEAMEISPDVISSNKRLRHSSSKNNSLVDEERTSEFDDSPPVVRPIKRLKNLKEKTSPSSSSSESSDSLPECMQPSLKEPNLLFSSTVKCIVTPATPVSSHNTPALSEQRPFSAPQLRSMEVDSDYFELSTLGEKRSTCSLQSRNESTSGSNSETTSTGCSSVPSTITLTGDEDEDLQISSTEDLQIGSTISSAEVVLYERESLNYFRSVIWRLLSFGIMNESRKRARWPTSLSVSKMLEMCTWICTKVICWVEMSMRAIRKGDRRTPAVANRGPVVSLEMLRSVKLRSSQSRRRSAERNKGGNRFPFNSPR
ncbi:hypothetical protein C0J52_01969 [Blattella germanica]|nr:hypothetical protein C0J52_01969 [Blattella germanica]